MLSIIRRWMYGPPPQQIDLPQYGVIDCDRCHKYLRTGFALSLIGHLEIHHAMHEDDAIRVGTHMLDLLHEAKRKARRDTR